MNIEWDDGSIQILLGEFMKYHLIYGVPFVMGELFLLNVTKPRVFVQKYSSANMKSKIGTTKDGIEYIDGTKSAGGSLIISPDDYQYRWTIPKVEEWVSRSFLMDCIVELGIHDRESLEFESDREDMNIMVNGHKVASFGRYKMGDVSIETGSIHWKYNEELNKSVFDNDIEYMSDFCCSTPKAGIEEISSVTREQMTNLWISKLENYFDNLK